MEKQEGIFKMHHRVLENLWYLIFNAFFVCIRYIHFVYLGQYNTICEFLHDSYTISITYIHTYIT